MAARKKPTAPPTAPPKPVERRRIPLSAIDADQDVQARAAMDNEAVGDYAAAMQAGAVFPPVVVFEGADGLVLSDGFHRFEAARRAHADPRPRGISPGAADIECEVRPGTRRDAALFACGANAAHGLRRTNADKRKAVGRLLADAEWKQWTDRQIAEAAGVSNTFVTALRQQLSTDDNSARRKGKDGKTYKARKRRRNPKAEPATEP